MPTPIYTPRLNNNDDTVQLVAVHVAPGDRVKPGDLLAAVETDKSVLDLEADQEGFVLEICYAKDDKADVGSVLMWLGASPEESVPRHSPVDESNAAPAAHARPTAKAAILLRRYGLSANQVPAAGPRLTAAEVEGFAARRANRSVPRPHSSVAEPQPEALGTPAELSAAEQAMLQTVSWHRDHAANAYLEIAYDTAGWDRFAASYAAGRGLMLSPLLPLMAFRLVQLTRERPRLNSTIAGGKRYEYAAVNLGFTVQAGETLYLTVLKDAASLDLAQFIDALGRLQRNAAARKLQPSEAQGATLSFTSMSRWKVTRHVPILPPNTSLIVAHCAAAADGQAVLGASYDHRVLSGADVARCLNALAKPPD